MGKAVTPPIEDSGKPFYICGLCGRPENQHGTAMTLCVRDVPDFVRSIPEANRRLSELKLELAESQRLLGVARGAFTKIAVMPCMSDSLAKAQDIADEALKEIGEW